QWPEDVRPYFGDGDEFQMNFHFPWMPRIFMALAKADRTPIEQILARTPELPAGCQWGSFLRCHDELTLEMVTLEEREFMWDFYAPEPRMRLNRGIRRRLAPLLENNRARIEVANSIFLTLIGSPVLYYGDEIGMGDNIWLADRDGVRTPMQWDASENAGFSTAPAEQLTDPVIRDEIYGYQKINVAAQRENPESLLNRMRELLRIRKEHPAFGRGELHLLEVHPDAVLVYLRITAAETLIIFNNLAPESQTVSVDLADYAGKTPVDILTGETYPIITEDLYVVELAGYGYCWLKL
ncbi:MAG: alpha-glucosidase C-terminal domain-containing protein, partial [Anaerolineae bacterium]|nr:alpha-glucosidase C-terminal domain-containing protein [Anaerolineae bacterium]